MRIVLMLCLLPFGLITPLLEIGPTHVFNPHWPGHARLHEVWQLATHIGLAGLCAWLGCARGNLRLASFIGLLVTTGFLLAVVLAPFYGGTMRHTDGSEITVAGVNLAVAIMVATTAGLAAVFLSASRPARPSGTR